MTTVEDYIRRTVDAAPPLSADQRDRLAVLLRGESCGSLPRMDDRPPPVRKCALYRHFDADDVLLYVGISVQPDVRGREHARKSAWMEFATRQAVVWLSSPDEALAAERAAIHDERPLFNKVGADVDREQRLRAYILDHHAYHLLRLP